MKANRLREFRESRMISRMELARRAGIGLRTLVRVEEGKGCWPETRRRILAALGISPGEKHKVFPED